MDFPPTTSLPRAISTGASPFSAAREAARIGGLTDIGTVISFSSANRAVYIPFWTPWPYPVRRVFWGNGSAITGNKDFGIYTMDGVRIYSTGSTAEAGTSVLQYVTVSTPFLLPPGRYFMAITCSIIASHGWGLQLANSQYAVFSGFLQQDTALPLPAAATFAAYSGTVIPLCGITRYTS